MLLGRSDDASLVESSLAGDARSVEALVIRYQRKAYAVARAIALDTPAADRRLPHGGGLYPESPA